MAQSQLSDIEVIATLNDLIENVRDAQSAFTRAAQSVKGNQLRVMFNDRARHYERYAEGLARLVIGMSGEPATERTATGVLRSMWTDMQIALSNDEPKAVLREAVHGEKGLREAYAEALTKALPDDIDSTVRAQAEQIDSAHQELCAVLDSIG